MKNNKPYYAVIFTSVRVEHTEGYGEMAQKMFSLARQQPGFLHVESASGDVSITVSYWESLDAIKNWKKNTEHLVAQRKGIADWYQWYHVKICKVEREYEFSRG